MSKQSVTLGWDPSPDPNAAGYNVYYGTQSHTYTTKVQAGNVTNLTVSGLTAGATYYFAATTYDIFNQESGFSEEVSYTVPATSLAFPTTNSCIVGQNVVLSASIGETGPLSYQWKWGASYLPRATSSSLVLNDVQLAQGGTYIVTVSGGTGWTTNITFNLEVYPTAAATLTQPAFAAGKYSFLVAGVPGFEYVVQDSTNLLDWVCEETNIAPFEFIETGANPVAQIFFRSFATLHQAPPGDPVTNLPAVPAPNAD